MRAHDRASPSISRSELHSTSQPTLNALSAVYIYLHISKQIYEPMQEYVHISSRVRGIDEEAERSADVTMDKSPK